MAEQPAYSDSDSEAGTGPDRHDAGTPRWVKVSGIVGVVMVLLFIIMMLIGGGSHGPGRHTGGDGEHNPSYGVTEYGARW